MPIDLTNATSPDTTTILLNVTGWIVAGFVTLLGVLAAHWIQKRGEYAHEAEISIYQPLAAEMFSILSQKYLVAKGSPIWTQPSPEFGALHVRGVLYPKRHGPLRSDVEELLRGEQACAIAHGKLHQTMNLSAVQMWQTVYKELGRGLWDQDIIGFMNSPDAGASSNLLQALVRADKEAFVRDFTATVNGIGKGAANPPLTTTAEQHYALADKAAGAARTDYQTAAEALFAQAERLRHGLEAAMERGRFYR